MNPHVLVLTGDGINCEQETAAVFKNCGAEVSIKSLHEFKADPTPLLKFQILALPGGFSYGDEIHSGQVLAMQIKNIFGETWNQFLAQGGLILGICNGFQALMKLGAFEPKTSKRTFTLTHNRQHHFQDRWVQMTVRPSVSKWTVGMEGQTMKLPIRHGEGRIWCESSQADSVLKKLEQNRQIVFAYTEDVNGSMANIAGLTDESGQILGLMPHPEAALDKGLFPHPKSPEAQSASLLNRKIFENAVNHWRNPS